MTLYYEADGITLYHGDCLEIDAWLGGDVLVTDPPYGIGWTNTSYAPNGNTNYMTHGSHIANDKTTEVRDRVVEMWGTRPAALFGDARRPVSSAKIALVWKKPANSGFLGPVAGFRRDWEAIFLCGEFPPSKAERSGVIETGATHYATYINRNGHPHAKPDDVMETLIEAMPPGTVVDPFAGSGSTLLAARNQGRTAIGVEIEERYCETIAGRLAQGLLI